jgi:hypothetical protein
MLTPTKKEQANWGVLNGNWKGNTAQPLAARKRAERLYPCPKEKERHHKDGNPYNNSPENIELLTRKEHMIKDGRLNEFLKTKNFWKKGVQQPPWTEDQKQKHHIRMLNNTYAKNLKGRHVPAYVKEKMSKGHMGNKSNLGKHWRIENGKHIYF